MFEELVKHRPILEKNWSDQCWKKNTIYITMYRVIYRDFFSVDRVYFFLNLVKSNQNQIVCNYHFPISLAPNRIPFGVKSFGKW